MLGTACRSEPASGCDPLLTVPSPPFPCPCTPPVCGVPAVASYAAVWATHLTNPPLCGKLIHGGPGKGYGQNLAVAGTWRYPHFPAADGVNMWVKEGDNYTYALFDTAQGGAGCKTGNWEDCGHYTQVGEGKAGQAVALLVNLPHLQGFPLPLLDLLCLVANVKGMNHLLRSAGVLRGWIAQHALHMRARARMHACSPVSGGLHFPAGRVGQHCHCRLRHRGVSLGALQLADMGVQLWARRERPGRVPVLMRQCYGRSSGGEGVGVGVGWEGCGGW